MQEYKVTIDINGTERWHNKDGALHREDDKPAVIYTDGTQYWYKNGHPHRENGPAIMCANGDQYWYVNGIERPNPNKFKELTVAAIEALLGYRIKIVK
jgi:hypothetical protein